MYHKHFIPYKNTNKRFDQRMSSYGSAVRHHWEKHPTRCWNLIFIFGFFFTMKTCTCFFVFLIKIIHQILFIFGVPSSFSGPDNHKTFLNWEWLEENGPGQQMAINQKPKTRRVLWDRDTYERHLPADVRFNDLMRGQEGLKTLLETLYTYGIAFVSQVPASTLDTQVYTELDWDSSVPLYGSHL